MPQNFDSGHIRKLSYADPAQFRDHLLRLTPEARRSRFAMKASDAFLRAYAETSSSLGTVIHGYFEAGVLRAVAELRPIDDRHLAEAAFSVEEGWQNTGLGTRLMELTLIAARNRGIEHIYVNCLATNRAMQILARKFAAELTFEAGDVVGRLHPSRPSLFSLLRESMSDSFAMIDTAVDKGRRKFGAG